jgi:hypothetical protein
VRSVKPPSASCGSRPFCRGPRRASFRRAPRLRPAAARRRSGNSWTRNARRPPRSRPCARHRPAPTRRRENGCPDSDWRMALRLDEDRPARAEAAEGVVEAAGDRDQFGCDGGSRSGPRKRAVRWKLPSLLSTTPVPTSAAQGRKSASRVFLLRYSARFIIGALPSDREVRGDAQVAAADIDEQRIALGRPHRRDGRWPRSRCRPARGAGPGRARRPACRS